MRVGPQGDLPQDDRPPTGLSARTSAALRLALFASAVLMLLPVQQVLVWIGSPASRWLPSFFHRMMTRVFGIRVEVRGVPVDEQSVLFVSNHSTYLDITVLGGVLTGCVFVAKTEVRSYPLFGYLARLQRTIFVDRRVRTTAKQRDSLVERLSRGERVVLFPEGTSSDGNRVLPFKSSLLGAAEIRLGADPATNSGGRAIAVQPVSVTYTQLDGMPMGRTLRPMFAWYGDMDLAPHLWEMAGLGAATVVVEFHAPVSIDAFGSRKALTDHCWRAVASGVASALSGREQRIAPPPAPTPPAALPAQALP